MSERKIILVLALNLKQFDHHAYEKFHGRDDVTYHKSHARILVGDDREYRYVRDAHSIRGLRVYGVERWGQWWLRKDLEEVETEIRMRVCG